MNKVNKSSVPIVPKFQPAPPLPSQITESRLIKVRSRHQIPPFYRIYPNEMRARLTWALPFVASFLRAGGNTWVTVPSLATVLSIAKYFQNINEDDLRDFFKDQGITPDVRGISEFYDLAPFIPTTTNNTNSLN